MAFTDVTSNPILAAQKLSNEKPGQTLQATALVHEVYMRLPWAYYVLCLIHAPTPGGARKSLYRNESNGTQIHQCPFKLY